MFQLAIRYDEHDVSDAPRSRGAFEVLPTVRLPVMRAECEGEGLCPKFSCRYNFTFELASAGRSVAFWKADDEAVAEKVAQTLEGVSCNCALDVAEAAQTLEEVAVRIGLTKERVRQIEVVGLRKIGASPHAADFRDALEELRTGRDARCSTEMDTLNCGEPMRARRQRQKGKWVKRAALERLCVDCANPLDKTGIRCRKCTTAQMTNDRARLARLRAER